MTWSDPSVFLVLLVLSTTSGSISPGRHARDLKILSKSTTNENHQIHKEKVHELTITGDSLELQALIRAIESRGTGGAGRPTISTVTNQLNYLGCFKEVSGRLLKGAMGGFKRSLTPEICLSYCKTKGMRYFGLQYSSECFCSTLRPSCGILADDNECNMECEGNPREMCGGSNRLSVYDSVKPGTDQPNFMGCFKDNTNGRLLQGAMETFMGTLTLEICLIYCKTKGMRYFGLQYSDECFCSVETPSLEEAAGFNECNMRCSGNHGETCGGVNRLSVYDSKTDRLNFMGCYKDNTNGRLLNGARKDFRGSLTTAMCLSYCKTKGMRYFGLQYSVECFCSMERPSCNELARDVECNMKCEGNPKEMCGGENRLSVYDSN